MITIYDGVLITWAEIKQIWDEELWPGRDSKPINNWLWSVDNPLELTIDKWQQSSVPIYIGIKTQTGKLVGVNSLYVSSEDGVYSRSRGLYIKPEYRGKGLAKELLAMTIALSRRSKYLWTVPREDALGAYESIGFVKKGTGFTGDYGMNYIAVLENKLV
jgi:GNAT superfamily N-acetyltransferase